MIGEGIKRQLLSESFELFQCDTFKDVAIVVYKRKRDYVKVHWKILNKLAKPISKLTYKDYFFFFKEEIRGNVEFLSAEYMSFSFRSPQQQITKKISEDEYAEIEFIIHDDLTIKDDFLHTLAERGRKYIAFENYLNTSNRDKA